MIINNQKPLRLVCKLHCYHLDGTHYQHDAPRLGFLLGLLLPLPAQ